MDVQKFGRLLSSLRHERGMTQRALADKLGVSDRAVSKWERGCGCPDISLISSLAKIFDVSAEKLLSGELEPNAERGGNMKKLRFYVCPECGNIITSTGEAEVSCCSRKLAALEPKTPDAAHEIATSIIDDERFVELAHPMEKGHFISFVAYLWFDRLVLVRLYPEQSGEVRLPRLVGGTLYWYCSRDGLFMEKA